MRGALLCFLVGFAAGHGVLTVPEPRLGTGLPGQGTKLTPFSSARGDANRGCGGTANNDPGFARPKAAYTPGQNIPVSWDLTIPHPDDNMDTGVRIAIHYADDDSFSRNIIIGCLEGEEGCNDQNSAGQYINRASAAAETRLATLPATKTCNYCVIQWVWAAKSDGGYYMTCADIAITADGLLPDYDLLEAQNGPETDTNGNGLPDGVAGGNPNPNTGEGADGESIGIGVGVVIVVVIVLLLGFYCYKKGCPSRGGGGGSKTGGGAAGGLPPGWTAAIDPSSNRTYYVNATTGETTWDMPKGGGGMMAPPPMPPPPGGGALPPGWQAAVDPASGRTYYVNSVTGATSWEAPR